VVNGALPHSVEHGTIRRLLADSLSYQCIIMDSSSGSLAAASQFGGSEAAPNVGAQHAQGIISNHTSEADSVGGLTSRPPSMPGGGVAATSSTAAAAVMQGSVQSADAGVEAAKARRRQQRADELRAAALAPVVERTAQQVGMKANMMF
jgi:hypothetical protein